MTAIKVFLRDGRVMIIPAGGVVGAERNGSLFIGKMVKPKDGSPQYNSPFAVFARGVWSHFFVVDMSSR